MRTDPDPTEPSPTVEERQTDLKTVLAQLDAWEKSNEYEQWIKAQARADKERYGPPEMYRRNLRDADLTDADLRGAKLSAPYPGGGALHLEDASDLRGAHLTRANLQGARLRGVDLRGAFLEDANLSEADLCYAKLHGARVQRTNFSGATLSHVEGLDDAHDHRLTDVNLEGATGLTGSEFARTNLTGAKLPHSIRDFTILNAVNEVSSNAQTAFVSMILAVAYCWLTVASTVDARLLTNSTSSPLPVIQTPVPIAWFYGTAPFILFAIFIWFHLYLQDMWKGLAGLPAIFPDGKPLDEKVNPWLLTGFVRPHFELLSQHRPPLSRTKSVVSIVLAWWLVPATLVLFWLRYLARHDWPWTTMHVLLVAGAIASAGYLQRLARRTLRGELAQPEPMARKLAWVWIGAAVLLVAGVVSDGAINGVRGVDYPGASTPQALVHRRIVPRLLASIAVRPFASLSDAAVSTRPENWFLAPRGEPLDAVQGAALRNANLRYARAQRAFLAKADLRDANLEGADLREADLQQADLRRARLPGAIVAGANLTRADLDEADLRNAVGVTQRQLDTACVTDRTQIPSGLERPQPCTR